MLTPPGDVLPGPHHLTPPCKHYPRCGGCQLQHLDDIAYARYLVERIEGALAAQGLESDIRPPLLSPDRSRRRAVFHAERRGRQVWIGRSGEHTSELQSLMRISYAGFCLKKNNHKHTVTNQISQL